MKNSLSRVALYSRVSTHHGQDPELQLRELREYATSRGWNVIEEYVDQGVSGTKTSRPALNRLMADAHRRKIDVILVWKLDVLGAPCSTWSTHWLNWELFVWLSSACQQFVPESQQRVVEKLSSLSQRVN